MRGTIARQAVSRPSLCARTHRVPGRSGNIKPVRGNKSSNQALQAKLRVGRVDDPLEREADRIADRVVAGDDAGPIGTASARPQRKCAECVEEDQTVQRQVEDEEEEEELQLKAEVGGPPAPGAEMAAGAVATGGKPLGAAERAYFEPRFGRDLSAVRIHDTPRVHAAAAAINARAFTLGNNVAFAPGHYDLRTDPGRRLMAHELAHVVQQNLLPSARTIRQGGAERDAQLSHEVGSARLTLTRPARRMVQRRGEPPPRRPTPSGKRSREATPKDVYEIRSAILSFEPDTIRPEDIAALTNAQLRSLDSACEWAIEVAGRFAAEQAADSSWSPPPGYPDIIYKNAQTEIKDFRRDQVLVRKPYATLLATENFFAEEGGDTPATKQHWNAAMPLVKELVWRMELGSAERTESSLLTFLSDLEIIEHAYLTENAWEKARKDPLNPGEGIEPEKVLAAVKDKATVIPVRLARAAVAAAGRVSEEDRKDPEEAAKVRVYNQIQVAMESELVDIDTAAQAGLTYINSQRVTGGIWESGTTHENSFWKLLWSEPAGRDWKALQRYRSWAGE